MPILHILTYGTFLFVTLASLYLGYTSPLNDAPALWFVLLLEVPIAAVAFTKVAPHVWDHIPGSKLLLVPTNNLAMAIFGSAGAFTITNMLANGQVLWLVMPLAFACLAFKVYMIAKSLKKAPQLTPLNN